MMQHVSIMKRMQQQQQHTAVQMQALLCAKQAATAVRRD
jgi:hypothetical protein